MERAHHVITGAFSYSGAAIARRLLDAGERVITLTGHPRADHPLWGRVEAHPFCFDMTPCVKEGENTIRVKVVNTLANHMSTYPTSFVYEGQTVSGMLGPVQLRFLSPVRLTAAPPSG